MEIIFQVFEIPDLNHEIMKLIDQQSWRNLMLSCKRFLSCNIDLFKKKYRKGKYADLSHTGWEWIANKKVFAHPLPFFLIKPNPTPTNINCSAQTKAGQRCQLKALPSQYCCRIHSNQEANFISANQPLAFFPCKCSACMSSILPVNELDKRRFRKNIINNHCNWCECIKCVCPARIKAKHYQPDEDVCYWDGPCMNRCYTCRRDSYGEDDV